MGGSELSYGGGFPCGEGAGIRRTGHAGAGGAEPGRTDHAGASDARWHQDQGGGERWEVLAAVDRLEQRLEKKPQQLVGDSGYTTRENIEKMAGREIDFLGTMRYENVPRGANLPNRFSAERISLSASEEPLCLPAGQSPASGGTPQEESCGDLPPLQNPPAELPSLS